MTQNEGSYWRYGLVAVDHEPLVEGADPETEYGIYELYFNRAGILEGRTAEPATFVGESVHEVQGALLAALRESILRAPVRDSDMGVSD